MTSCHRVCVSIRKNLDVRGRLGLADLGMGCFSHFVQNHVHLLLINFMTAICGG